MFGGPAWSRVTEADGSPGQWYLHLFDAAQPDLNWFWLDRGVDGFRIEVAHGMAKPPDPPDMELDVITGLLADGNDDPRFNHAGVHDIYRDIRTVRDDYPHAVSIGELQDPVWERSGRTDWSTLTVERQLADPGSTLNLFRELIRLRHSTFRFDSNDIEWVDCSPPALR